MSIKVENVKLIRFAHGEEIVAEVMEEGLMSVTFHKPIQVVMVPNRSTPENPTIGFGPWCQFAKEETFTVNRSHILVIVDPIKEFVDQYVSIHSGVRLPQKSGLVIPRG